MFDLNLDRKPFPMNTEDDSQPGRAQSLKEAYVDDTTIEAKAMSWIEQISRYNRHPFGLGSLGKKPALLVMDMQRFFLDDGSGMCLPAGKAIIPGVKSLIGFFRERGFPVIFTRHLDRPSDSAGPMYSWWGRRLGHDNPLTELHPEMGHKVGEMVIEKHAYSAFYETRLNVLLKRLSITSIMVTGVMTHLCCESTARDAFMRGFKVIMAIDGTATLNEMLHLSTFRNLSHGFATPALIREAAMGIEC